MSAWDKIFRFDYAKDLHAHLKGWAIDCNSGYTRQSIYQSVSVVMIVLVLLGTLNYYYGFFNRPRFSKTSFWLLNMLCISIIIFVMAYIMSSSGLHDGNHCPDLHFYSTDCMLFGFTAVIYTIIFYVVASLIVKWFSLNNKKVPF
jgi:hypothetical protein